MKPIHLRDARERAGLTQDELAAAADVPQSVISRLENGATENPAFSTMLGLAKALGVPVESLRVGPQKATA